MILKIIIILLGVLLLAGFMNFIWDVLKYRNVLSFKESLDATGVPIVTLISGSKKLNFVIDSGASMTTISKNDLKSCSYEETGTVMDSIGVEGNEKTTSIVNLKLKGENGIFETEALITDFDPIKQWCLENHGIEVHGLMGTNFLAKYNYILDFSKSAFYTKNYGICSMP